MSDKLMNVVRNICQHIYDAVKESERWYDFARNPKYEQYRDCGSFQHECMDWVDGVLFCCGGFAEGDATDPDHPKIYWIDLDFLRIEDVKEGALTPEEKEELKHFFNPERESFDLRKVLPEEYWTPRPNFN